MDIPNTLRELKNHDLVNDISKLFVKFENRPAHLIDGTTKEYAKYYAGQPQKYHPAFQCH